MTLAKTRKFFPVLTEMPRHDSTTGLTNVMDWKRNKNISHYLLLKAIGILDMELIKV